MTMPCPKCNRPNKPTARFCAYCGTALPAATAPVTAPPVPPPPPPPAAIPPQKTGIVPPPAPQQTNVVPPQSAPTQRCPHCGKMNRGAAKRCAYCGKPLTAPMAPPPQPARRLPIQASAIILAILILCVCASLSGIFASEFIAQPTPTLAIARATPTITTEPPTPTLIASALATLTPTPTANPPHPVVVMEMTGEGRFGLRTKEGDPTNPDDDNKPLTYNDPNKPPNGSTNNTRIWVDGKTPLFGEPQFPFLQAPKINADHSEMAAVWFYNNVVFTQTVRVVLSTSTHRFDTFRINYEAENRDTIAHTVGIRVMLDTLIGDNDGVPFVVPGRSGLITSTLDLRGNDIPNFVQALEKPDPTNPGVAAQLTLSGADATRPDRLLISPWCKPDVAWDYFNQVGAGNQNLYQCGEPLKRDGSRNKLDSAIGMFFDPKPLEPGATREWTMFYGLGGIARIPITSTLTVSTPPQRVELGEQFWFTALIKNPKPGQRVKITLPPELRLVRGDPEQAVPQGDVQYTQVSWLLQAAAAKDDLNISVTLLPENETISARTSVFAPPTPTPTVTPTRCVPSTTNRCP